MRKIGVIGAGRIARPVIAHLALASAFELVAVLRRGSPPQSSVRHLVDLDAFLAAGPDLILDLASPAALAAFGAACLARADVWSVNGSALADPAVSRALEGAASASGRRLRLLSGAIAGLDGVATAARDPTGSVSVRLERPGIAAEPGPVFRGSAREAAVLFPHETNVAVAVALAGPGLDRTTVEIVSAPPGGHHRLSVEASSRYGLFTARSQMRPDEVGFHPVAASVIAALERETCRIQVG